MEKPLISVIICTYNANTRVINQVLSALKSQTLSFNKWELIIIDNNSDVPVIRLIDTSWHPLCKVIIETQAGLSFARVTGFEKSKGNLIVFVDDDNIVKEDYLQQALAFHEANPRIGCFAGKSIAIFESAPPPWLGETQISLGCQDFGNLIYISNYQSINFQIDEYPDKAPIGTGMVITKLAFAAYIQSLTKDKLNLGRKGASLISGEDNDIILTIIKAGFEIAYCPQLVVQHIIPAYRYSFEYLKEMAFKSNISWIKVLAMHSITRHKKISKWTVVPRQLRAWFKCAAWKGPVNYLKWRGACGLFKGLSEI